MEKPIIVVSGLPRSGTSMMMRMLKLGGIELVEDNQRTADEDNPRGYFEDDRVKKLKDDSSWIDAGLQGKAIKVISYLLRHLPTDRRFKVLFMDRDMRQVLASQRKMLERQKGQVPSEAEDELLARKFAEHLDQVDAWIRRQPCMECLHVPYQQVIDNPLEHARRIAEFLGMDLDVASMASAVDGSLFRNR